VASGEVVILMLPPPALLPALGVTFVVIVRLYLVRPFVPVILMPPPSYHQMLFSLLGDPPVVVTELLASIVIVPPVADGAVPVVAAESVPPFWIVTELAER